MLDFVETKIEVIVYLKNKKRSENTNRIKRLIIKILFSRWSAMGYGGIGEEEELHVYILIHFVKHWCIYSNMYVWINKIYIHKHILWINKLYIQL